MMFTQATEGVFILSSLESVSTFGRVYLDEFIRPESTELTHFVSCIASMQMYFNEYSIIQTICAISTFSVAAIYQVWRILITPIIFIVHRVFYLSCAATNSRASLTRNNHKSNIERLDMILYNAANSCASRTVTRNNHTSNIERLDMILYNAASTSLFSTPFNIRFISHRHLSASDNFIVNGKRILIGYPGIENPSPSRVLITISKRHANSHIADSSTSHAQSLNILCDINRRSVSLQQEMFIRTYLMAATLPKEIFHTFRAYQMPVIEEGTRITEIDETDIFTAANESASLSGLIEDCESVNAANEPILLQSVPHELLPAEPFNVPETAIIDEGARHISETVEILEPVLGPSSPTSTHTPISEKDAESINSTVKPELALFAVDDIDFDFGLPESCPVERVPTERIGAATNILVSDDIDFDFDLPEPCPVERVLTKRIGATTNILVTDDIDFDFGLPESCPVERMPTERIGATTNILVTDDIDFDFGLSEPYPIGRVSIASTQDETTRECRIRDDQSGTMCSEIPEPSAQIPTGRALIQLEEWSMLPNGQANREFFDEMNFFYDRIFTDIRYRGESFTEIPRERVLHSLNTFKSLSKHIVQLSESSNTSRGARVEGSFRPWNDAIHEDPMKYLSFYCYDHGCRSVERHQQKYPYVSKEYSEHIFEQKLHKHKKLANGRISPSLIWRVFEAYRFGVIEEANSENFMKDIQKTFSENRVTADVEQCIDYLDMVITKVEHNLPIIVNPLYRISNLYKPLRDVYAKYNGDRIRGKHYMTRYRDLMDAASSMDIEKEYGICKKRIDAFSTLSKDNFNSSLYASRRQWDIKKAEKLELQDLRKEMYPHQRIRRRDTFHALWRNIMRWTQ